MESPTVTAQSAAPIERPAIDRDAFCFECGYNLRGLTSDRCPECGESIDLHRTDDPRLPWAHRAKIGWFQAYWKSVALVMFEGRKFCAEISRPVSYADSQKFRWLTVLFAFLPLVLGTIWFSAFSSGRLMAGLDLRPQQIPLWALGLAMVMLLLFLAAATGLPSYFFHPHSLDVNSQNRAIALSYYASGSLAVMFLPVLCLILADVYGVDGRLGMAFGLLAGIIPAFMLLGWWLDLIRVLRKLVPARPWRYFAAGVLIPSFWLVVAVLIFVGLPLVGYCVVIVVQSFLVH